MAKVPISSQSENLFLVSGCPYFHSLSLEEDVHALGSIVTRSLVIIVTLVRKKIAIKIGEGVIEGGQLKFLFVCCNKRLTKSGFFEILTLKKFMA